MLKVLLVCVVLASVALATTSASKTLAPTDKAVPVKPKKVRTFEPTYAPEPKPPAEPEEGECKPCKKKAAPPAKPEIKDFVPELTDGKLVRHHEKKGTAHAEPRTIEPQYVPEPVKAEDDKDKAVEKPKKKEDKDRLPVVAEIKPEPPKRRNRRRCHKGGCKHATFRNWRDAKRWLRSKNARAADEDNDNDKEDKYDRDTTSPPDMSGTTDGPVVAFARPVHGGLDDSDRVVDDAQSADPEVPGTSGPADAEPLADDKESQANAAARAAMASGKAAADADADSDTEDKDDKEDQDQDEEEDDKAPAATAAPAKP